MAGVDVILVPQADRLEQVDGRFDPRADWTAQVVRSVLSPDQLVRIVSVADPKQIRDRMECVQEHSMESQDPMSRADAV